MKLPDFDLDIDENVSVPPPKKLDKSEEASGKLDSQFDEDKLMKSVMENDNNEIDDGQMISDSINQGLGSFTPDVMFEKMVSNYKQAKQIYGDSLIRAVSGYDPGFVEKNVKIPEFRRELEKRIKEKMEDLRKKGLIDRDGTILDRGLELASLVMYVQELEDLQTTGLLGERPHRKDSIYGEKNNIKNYQTNDRFRDLDIKKSAKTAIRRGHPEMIKEDLKIFTRQHKSNTQIVYAIDASGSMKGEKIGVSKKAGIALAFKALEKKDKVGVMVFGKEVKAKIAPTTDFMEILKTLSVASAASETDLANCIAQSVDLFLEEQGTKHLILITDAMPTVGESPEDEVVGEVAKAKARDITVSIVGINLDSAGERLAKKICDAGEGQFHIINDLKNMDKIILEDYYSFY